MSKLQTLRGFIIQRLTSAAEEIFELFERTISEYEEQLSRSKEENERQNRLLDAVFNPEEKFNQADSQQLLERRGEVPPELQERNPSLDKEVQTGALDPPHIKKEEEELWTSQETQQLHGLEEEDIIKFTFSPVPDCHAEDPGEEPESSQLHENQSEESRDAEVQNSGSSESDGNFNPDTSHSFDSQMFYSVHYEGRSPPQPGLNSLLNNEAGGKPFSCRVCGKRFHQKRSLANHMRVHSEGHSFSCSVCQKTFPWRRDVVTHMRVHTGERPFSCSDCDATFAQSAHLTLHSRVHTGEKPFTCSVCNSSFRVRKTLRDHMMVHTGEKPHNCSVCGKGFAQRGALRRHMAVHTGVKRFYCSACDRPFTRLEHVRKHKCVGERRRNQESFTEDYYRRI